MSNKLVFILIGVMLLVFLGLGGGLFMMWSKMSSMNAQVPTGPNAHAATPQAPVLGPIFSLDTFIVNLADKGGNRYLRVTMDLEMTNTTLTEELKLRLPQVRDTALTILPNKRFEDISTADGKASLRTELMEQLNSFLSRGQITNIYFREFVVQ